MSQNIKVCDIPDELKGVIRKFRFRKSHSKAALILKVDRHSQLVCVDELLDDLDSFDDLQHELNGHQPRFILYSSRVEHTDGRFSIPMIFIYFTPQDCDPQLQMMYAGTVRSLVQEAAIDKAYDIRDIDDLTEHWLNEKLRK